MNQLDPVIDRIRTLLDQHPVVLFMKGTRGAPRCGFSAAVVEALDAVIETYHTVDVLEDAEIREGIKRFGDWPTLPQLYLRGELIGGADIVRTMFDSGELHSLFERPAPDRTPPRIHVDEQAAQSLQAAVEQAHGHVIRLSIDAGWQPQFMLGEARSGDIVAEAGGVAIHLDLVSAQRANGMSIEWVDGPQGSGLKVSNPNAPREVAALGVRELASAFEQGDAPLVVDIRPAHARALAPFPKPHQCLEEIGVERLLALPKDSPMAFLCHHGTSSRQVAEHFRRNGFVNLFNIEGGIDAWAMHVDPTVPRY